MPMLAIWLTTAVSCPAIDCSHLILLCVSEEARIVASHLFWNYPSARAAFTVCVAESLEEDCFEEAIKLSKGGTALGP